MNAFNENAFRCFIQNGQGYAYIDYQLSNVT